MKVRFCILNAILHFLEIIGLDLKNGGVVALCGKNTAHYAQ